MFGLRYMKADPTVYVMHYHYGKLRAEGPGLSFFYFAPTSSLVAVPLNTVDLPFAFTEATSDFQTVTLQGQISYRVVEPKRLAALLNFTLRPGGGSYESDDPIKLRERLVNHLHALTRAEVQLLDLHAALRSTETLMKSVRTALSGSELLKMHGIEVLTLSFLSIRPTPETAKALEAEAREALLRRSDEAIYARRNAAVEQERKIKESELNTELAVDEKERQIREAKLHADITLEQEKQRAEVARKDEKLRADLALEDAKAKAILAQQHAATLAEITRLRDKTQADLLRDKETLDSKLAAEQQKTEASLKIQQDTARSDIERQHEKMRSDVELELERTKWVDQHIANERRELENRAYATEIVLKPMKELDWRALMAIGKGMDSKTLIAMAFKEMAENAGKIGELNMSPDLLSTLLDKDGHR